MNEFPLFRNNISLEKRTCQVLYLNTIESSSSKNAFVKFGWNWPCGSGDFLNFVNGFSLSRNYLPMEKGVALYLPTTNGCFVQSFLVVLEKMNKRPMHHIAHLKNKFISINTYGYIITLIRRRQKKPRGPWATSLTWVNSSNQ